MQAVVVVMDLIAHTLTVDIVMKHVMHTIKHVLRHHVIKSWIIVDNLVKNYKQMAELKDQPSAIPIGLMVTSNFFPSDKDISLTGDSKSFQSFGVWSK